MSARISSGDNAVRGGSGALALGAVMLLVAALAPSPSHALSGTSRIDTLMDLNRELNCLALNIYFEARGESHEGQLAVGHVVLNRVSSDRFPNTICDVVRQGIESHRYTCQFSWMCDGQSDRPRDTGAWEMSRRLAFQVFVGRAKDPTGGALWYHADYVSPFWGHVLKANRKIGQHIFYVTDVKAKVAWARPSEEEVAPRPARTADLREALTVDPT